MTIGQMLHHWLTKLDWFSTLFPRIPVPVQKQIETKVNNYCRQHNVSFVTQNVAQVPPAEVEKRNEWRDNKRGGNGGGGRDRSRDRPNDSKRGYRSKSREKDRGEHRHRWAFIKNNWIMYEWFQSYLKVWKSIPVLKTTIFLINSYRRSRSRSPKSRGHHRRESRGRDYGESSRRRSRSVERDYERKYR